jgi:hypothetical protein
MNKLNTALSPLFACGNEDCLISVPVDLKEREFYECEKCKKYYCESCFSIKNLCTTCENLESFESRKLYQYHICNVTTKSISVTTFEQVSLSSILVKHLSIKELCCFDFVSLQLEGSPLVYSMKSNSLKIDYSLSDLLYNHNFNSSLNTLNTLNIYLLNGDSWCSCKEKTDFVDGHCPLCGLSPLKLTLPVTLPLLKPRKIKIMTSCSFGSLHLESLVEETQTIYDIFVSFYKELKKHNLISNMVFYHQFSVRSKRFCLCSKTKEIFCPLNKISGINENIYLTLLPYNHSKPPCLNYNEGLFSLQFLNSIK